MLVPLHGQSLPSHLLPGAQLLHKACPPAADKALPCSSSLQALALPYVDSPKFLPAHSSRDTSLWGPQGSVEAGAVAQTGQVGSQLSAHGCHNDSSGAQAQAGPSKDQWLVSDEEGDGEQGLPGGKARDVEMAQLLEMGFTPKQATKVCSPYFLCGCTDKPCQCCIVSDLSDN